MAERVVRLNVTKRESFTALIKGKEVPIKLSVRFTRAMRMFERLKNEHGSSNVALIPPKSVQDKVAAKHDAKQPRRKSKVD